MIGKDTAVNRTINELSGRIGIIGHCGGEENFASGIECQFLIYQPTFDRFQNHRALENSYMTIFDHANHNHKNRTC